MDLRRNSLSSLGFMNSLREGMNANFSLYKNPFSCNDCADMVLVWGTLGSRIVDSDNLTCWKKSGEEEEKYTVQDLSQLIDECSNMINTAGIQILIVCVAVLATACILMIIFMVRYSWVIKAYLFSKGWGWCLFWDKDADDDGQEKLYDAFVSFSHKVGNSFHP